ncbi:TetR/AcrR family transcriptional regulator [Rhodococcus sp. LB1]|jgi:AcrR family transcriptional regulator|uniref:TetR/AcrR family transcriptional regulator n=1 Tax=Rhodococcus sp. LB1 TaxID=1807499 RepID=UPI00077A886F|nr:TetR/AcrR family transcriptional regulator [Rhodococcus sp. LB1]KXX59212.1 TetR family transcriptional regulator [Rhodococcus sp. LB1]RZL80899.1 MAG: TetR/AcrR family transcriptional regulator [Rhodococcus sp. (in: high G+C Gram-positive bacteria)]
MAEATRAGRKPRADALRNRAHILEIAEAVFSEEGVTRSMDTIAKRAGVGPGTLYRHFPSRDALLAELLRSRDDTLQARRDVIEGRHFDSAAALEQWLDALGEWASAFDGLPDPLREALQEKTSPLALTCRGFITTTDDFLAAAQRDGTARPDVRGRELFLAVLATVWVSSAAMADASSATGLRTLLRSGWATG